MSSVPTAGLNNKPIKRFSLEDVFQWHGIGAYGKKESSSKAGVAKSSGLGDTDRKLGEPVFYNDYFDVLKLIQSPQAETEILGEQLDIERNKVVILKRALREASRNIVELRNELSELHGNRKAEHDCKSDIDETWDRLSRYR